MSNKRPFLTTCPHILQGIMGEIVHVRVTFGKQLL